MILDDKDKILKGITYVICGIDIDPGGIEDNIQANAWAVLGCSLSESFKYAAARRGCRVKPGGAYGQYGLFKFEVEADTPFKKIREAMQDAARENKTSLVLATADDLYARAINTEKDTPEQEIEPYAMYKYRVR